MKIVHIFGTHRDVNFIYVSQYNNINEIMLSCMHEITPELINNHTVGLWNIKYKNK